MQMIRALLLRHRALAMLVVAAALCLKAVMPAGTMIAPQSKVFTIQICADSLGKTMTRALHIPMKQDAGSAGKQSQAECPFASLAMASLSGADPVLLALAMAFILALGFAPVRTGRPRRTHYLRPPLRGPPALA